MIKMRVITLLTVVLAASTYQVDASPLNSTSCTVTSYKNVAAAVKSCTTLTLKNIKVPAKTTLTLDLKPGTKLKLQGTFKWEYAEWTEHLMVIKGSKITVDGSGATLDGRGKKYWDGSGDKGKKKPKFIQVKTTGGSKLKNIKLLNCPHQCVCINSASDTIFDNWLIQNSAGDTAGGKNTDGFDISSSNGITIKNSVVKNQDDCIAVNQGSNMIFKNITCSGGHGLSLSVGQSAKNGSPNTVSNVTFSDCTVTKSDNGIHVKTHSDAGTGAVKDVTYKNIKLSKIRKHAICIQQDYQNGASSGTPKKNIPISNLKLSSVTGSMTGDKNSMGVHILCAGGGCKSWHWSGVSIKDSKKKDSCNFQPSGYKC